MPVAIDIRKNEFVTKYDYGDGTVDLGDFVIRHTFGCPAGCVYCYRAEDHLRAPLKIFTNHERMLAEIQRVIDEHEEPLYFNAGENTDSLFLESQSGTVKALVEFFAQTNSFLELRTKCANVSLLLSLNHDGQTVVAYSMTPEPWVKTLEPGTATTRERILAAKQCADAGYKIAFVLDPMFYLPDWKKLYSELLEQIFSVFESTQISLFYLGTFRYTKGMLKIFKKNKEFENLLLHGEFVAGTDKKSRYFKPVRVSMYKHLITALREKYGPVPIFLSHEIPAVWEICLGKPRTLTDVLYQFTQKTHTTAPTFRINTRFQSAVCGFQAKQK